jgi:hypothetical protein
MTPKEKAKELVDRFRKEFNWVESDYDIDLYRDTRQCAIIAVDEICKLRLNIGQHRETDEDKENYYSYWEQVKTEINKL